MGGVRTFLLAVCILFSSAQLSAGVTRHYKFDVCNVLMFVSAEANVVDVFLRYQHVSLLQITLRNATRLCRTKSIVTVNGQFPGPRIVVREGDRLVVKVVNHVRSDITIHWYPNPWLRVTYPSASYCCVCLMSSNGYVCRHGIRQVQSGWADGPEYITQCPIRTGQSYVYNFTTAGQRGTLWWHAHASWLRATVYGSLVILPKRGVPYPFARPYKEVPIILGNH